MKKLVFVIFLLLANMAFAQTNEVISFDLEKNTTYVTDLGNNEFLYSFTYKAEKTTDLTVEVTLPPEYVVIDRNGLRISSPFAVSTDGRRITISWKDNLNAGEEFSAFVQYRGKGADTSIFLIPLIFVIGAVGVFAGYKLKVFKKEKFIKEVVSEDEGKVI